jgi:CRISPR-associated protein Cmr4
MLFIYTETSLHAGSGTSLGAVDLPIQRERMSGLPMVQGSGIKGALREQTKDLWKKDQQEDAWKKSEGYDLWVNLFGHEPPADPPQPEEQEMFAGALTLTDARLLLLPLRTVVGGWAWATCPMILDRLRRDLDTVRDPDVDVGPLDIQEDGALVGTKCTVCAGNALLIEDLEFASQPSSAVDALAAWLKDHALPGAPGYGAFKERLPGQLVILHDTDFTFMAEHATEVVTRIRIDPNTGTVANGALWTEESLPAETLLYSLALVTDGRRPKKEGGRAAVRAEVPRTQYKADALRKQLFEATQKRSRIRLGGDRTTGRGIVGLRMSAGGA